MTSPALDLILRAPNYPRRYGVVEHWPGTSVPRLATISHANDMTAVNSPTSVAGLVYPTAEQYVAASSQYDSLADNAAVSAGDIDFGIAGWVKLASKGSSRTAVNKWGASGQFAYAGPYYDSSPDRFVFYVSPDGTASASVAANALGSPSLATWYFVMNWHDATNNTINIRVNHGTVNSAAHTTGIFDNTTAFEIGRRSDGVQFWDGTIGDITLFKSPPGGIASIINELSSRLYNNGAGRVWPFR